MRFDICLRRGKEKKEKATSTTRHLPSSSPLNLLIYFLLTGKQADPLGRGTGREEEALAFVYSISFVVVGREEKGRKEEKESGGFMAELSARLELGRPRF